MPSLLDFTNELLGGLIVTVQIAVLSILGCAITSLVLGVLTASKKLPSQLTGRIAVEILRGTSVVVYLFWVYYALPLIPGMPSLSAFSASVLVISLVAGGYGAEIVRAGIAAIPAGQIDACHALGLTGWQSLIRVVIPQAVSQIVPAFGSLAVDVVKWTTVVSFVGVSDLFYVANAVRTVTFDTISIYGLLALIYIVLCTITSLFFRAIEWFLPLNRALRASRRPHGILIKPAPLFSRMKVKS